jgi:hypothetical protein
MTPDSKQKNCWCGNAFGKFPHSPSISNWEPKDFLFDFWRDYENETTGDERDTVIEQYSNELRSLLSTAKEETRRETLQSVVEEVEKIPDTEPKFESNEYDDGLKSMKSYLISHLKDIISQQK